MRSADVGIAGVAYAFPRGRATVRELAAAGRLESGPDVLERFGFGAVHTATGESPYDLALEAARSALTESAADPASVGLLIYGGATGDSAFAAGGTAGNGAGAAGAAGEFRYPATRLQYDLGLENAWTFGVNQVACTNLLSAVRIAGGLLKAEGLDRALCVMAEFFGTTGPREQIYNCVSDAACALVVERGCARNRVVAAVQVTKGYYWDADAMKAEVVASYFPTARHVIERTLDAAGWAADSVDWVVPHNVSRRSWEILLRLAPLPRARLWSENIRRRGHTLAGDNFINLRDAVDAGDILPGQRLLLFSYGYGAHWTGLAVEA